MAKRSYKLGARNTDFGAKNLRGQLSKNRWAWVRVYFGVFIIWADYRNDAEGNQTDEVIDLKLMHPIPGRAPLSWNLTALTEDELISMKHLFDTAFEWALPVVRQRDKEAQDAFAEGDDSHSRIYRQVPQLVYRSRPEWEHSEGVQHGSEDADGVSLPGLYRGGGLRHDGSDVAESDQDDSFPEDDESTPDLTEGVVPMGEVADGPNGVQGPNPGAGSPPSVAQPPR